MLRYLKRWPDTYAVLIRLTGLVALASVPLKHWPNRLERVVPAPLTALSHTLTLVLGVLLLYLASQVRLRKRAAWFLSVLVITGLLAVEVAHYRYPLQLILYVSVLLPLVISRKEFVVRSDPVSMRRGLLVSAGVFVAVLLVALLTFELIDQRAFGRELTTSQTVQVSLQQIFGFGLPSYVHLHRYDRMLLHILRSTLAVAGLVVFFSLFQPLRKRRHASVRQRRMAETILANHSRSVEDYLKLWPADKHYYFYANSFVAYGLANGFALVLDGASGSDQDTVQLREHFIDYCRLNGWQVAVLHADGDEVAAWQQLGFDRLFIGSEATVDILEFIGGTQRNKHFRYIANKAAKLGLEFEVWEPGFDDLRLAELRTVSNGWLANGHREYRFIMGCYDAQYLKSCWIVAIRQAGKVVAYANLLPTFVPGQASVDHIRSLPEAPGPTMHFLLMKTIAWLHGGGYKTFNLGLSPLSRLDEQLERTIAERVLSAIKSLGSRYYSFSGLEQFKGKFEPDWQPRYIVYQGGITRLPQVALATNVITAFRRGTERQHNARPWLIAAALVAGLSYASYPLAFVVNQSHAAFGLVSELGADGQPFSWLFNSLDLWSSVLASIVFAWILWRHRPRQQWLEIAAWAGLVAGVGDGVSAVLPLPEGMSWTSLLHMLATGGLPVLGHGLASMANSGGYLLSFVAWAWYRYNRRKRVDWVVVGAVLALSLATVGTLVGWIWPDTSGILQRAFISLYMLWLIGLVAELTVGRAAAAGKKSDKQ